MDALGGGLFLMSEVPLYSRIGGGQAAPTPTWLMDIQGYLAHKKLYPPRNLP